MASAGSKLTCRRCAGGWSSVCRVNRKHCRWDAHLDTAALLASIELRNSMGDGSHHSANIMSCRREVASPGTDGRSGWVQTGPASQPLGCAAGQTSHWHPHWPAGTPQPDSDTCTGAPAVSIKLALPRGNLTSSRSSSLLSWLAMLGLNAGSCHQCHAAPATAPT